MVLGLGKVFGERGADVEIEVKVDDVERFGYGAGYATERTAKGKIPEAS